MLDQESPIELILRGVDRVVPEDDLTSKLALGRPLRVKLGLDPTAPSVTLGWAVVLRKLRHFQELGHMAVLIVGDFTAQVGDPSGKTETRRRLAAEEVRGFALQLLSQFQRVLLPEPLEIRWNSEWLSQLDMGDVLELTSKVTVAHLLERSDFSERFEAGKPITLMEFLYPLLQGMDSVAIDADIELGGSDQLFNLLMGRILMERYGKPPQVALTMPLLIGLDGQQKMSQSLGNYVGVMEPPAEMYGKVMSIPDHLMGQWFRLGADLPEREVLAIEAGLKEGTRHPRDTKRRLAREIVTLYWDEKAAVAAEAAFDRLFRHHQAPEGLTSHVLGPADPVFLPALVRETGLASSAAEARRLIASGAVRVNGVKVFGEEVPRQTLVGAILQVGKRRFLRLVSET